MFLQSSSGAVSWQDTSGKVVLEEQEEGGEHMSHSSCKLTRCRGVAGTGMMAAMLLCN